MTQQIQSDIIKDQIPNGWVETTLGEVAEINPTESLPKGKLSKYIPMDCIDSFTRKIGHNRRKCVAKIGEKISRELIYLLIFYIGQIKSVINAEEIE